jgi:uncharacterized repeat protein (TIGR03803 family)
MSANAGSRNSSNQSLTKLALAARVLGKELRRLKLKRVDLARADLRLGEKAYATGMADGQAELLSKLDGVAHRITQLRHHEAEAASTFGEKAKALTNRIARAVQVGALQLKRRRLLRHLGANLRQGGTNSSEEARSASAVADRITATEAAITGLRPQTYPWARRPLLLISLLLLLLAIGGAFGLRQQSTAALAQKKRPDRLSLSDAQTKSMLTQQQTFQQQMQQMVAEATRRETEQRQARIAAAARTYQEQADRQRAAQEKLSAERAAADRVREAQEAKRAAERQKAAEEKQKEELRIAAAKEQQEAMEREKAARAQAEREQAERDRIAAETKSQQEERARTEREQAEREAQERQRLAEEKNKQVAEAQKKKQAKEEQASRERAEKATAFREEFKTEMLANARLKILCHLQNRVGPDVDLCADKAGNLYGIADGPAFKKSVFKVTPNGEFISLSNFDYNDFGPADATALVQGNDGNFYGATSQGVIYRITPEGQFSVVHKFGKGEGVDPQGGLTRGKDGNLYGVTRGGGSAEGGTIFKVTPGGALTTLHNLVKGSDDGWYPEGGLIQASDGSFYGTTSSGGTHGERILRMTPQGPRYAPEEEFGTRNGGTIFRMTPAGEVTTVHRLSERVWNATDEREGSHPNATLVEGNDRNFYGTTSQGGQNSRGTAFKVTREGELRVLYHFKEEGAAIRGFVRAADGNLYGITKGISRDEQNCGTIFRVDGAGQVNAVYVFKYRSWNWFGFHYPITPVSRLLPGSDGKLYGLTRSGGKRDAGVLFQFDPSDSFVASKEETAKAEEIASKAMLPPELRQRAVESAEDTEERRLYDSVLDMPGIDPGLARVIRPLFYAGADADHARRADSERVVNASGGAKMLCPKCKGYKLMTVHGHEKEILQDGSGNWFTSSSIRPTISIEACDECGGTGVVNAR